MRRTRGPRLSSSAAAERIDVDVVDLPRGEQAGRTEAERNLGRAVLEVQAGEEVRHRQHWERWLPARQKDGETGRENNLTTAGPDDRIHLERTQCRAAVPSHEACHRIKELDAHERAGGGAAGRQVERLVVGGRPQVERLVATDDAGTARKSPTPSAVLEVAAGNKRVLDRVEPPGKLPCEGTLRTRRVRGRRDHRRADYQQEYGKPPPEGSRRFVRHTPQFLHNQANGNRYKG
jgi:hypothetical protein